MLRVTEIPGADAGTTLKLEGKLLEAWAGEVVRACAGPVARSARVRLDLTAVIFIDAAGLDLLRKLLRQGVTVTACSGYVAELLHVEANHDGHPS